MRGCSRKVRFTPEAHRFRICAAHKLARRKKVFTGNVNRMVQLRTPYYLSVVIGTTKASCKKSWCMRTLRKACSSSMCCLRKVEQAIMLDTSHVVSEWIFCDDVNASFRLKSLPLITVKATNTPKRSVICHTVFLCVPIR